MDNLHLHTATRGNTLFFVNIKSKNQTTTNGLRIFAKMCSIILKKMTENSLQKYSLGPRNPKFYKKTPPKWGGGGVGKYRWTLLVQELV